MKETKRERILEIIRLNPDHALPTTVELAEQLEQLAFQRGVRAVAAFMGTWDQQIDHPYRMEDVILCKFNLRAGKPRLKIKKKVKRV